MKLTAIATLAYGISTASAYALYGGYERMFYYYGYMIDADVNGQPKKVAPSCKQTGKCTFNEFIKYINDLSKPVSVTSDELPEVHTTAQKLDTLQLTGAYKISRYIKEVRDRVKRKESIEFARASIESVCFLRKFARSEALRPYLEGKKVTPVIKKEVFNGKYYDLVDEAATIKKFSQAKKMIQDFDKADPSHNDNIKASCDAAARLHGG
ncbi:unnamed protein product [Aspergillus oryzae]|nr:unnamed protein product [Aspergillus oryzae]GMF85438.1 unnamed protein product [Aspergillus oryzae]GMG04188.1 unnamed protein product [Aspergillus oryzae]